MNIKKNVSNKKRFYRVNGVPNLLWVSMNNYAEYMAHERNYNLVKSKLHRDLIAKLCYGKFSYEIALTINDKASWFKDMNIDEIIKSISQNLLMSRSSSKNFGDYKFRKEVLGNNLK